MTESDIDFDQNDHDHDDPTAMHSLIVFPCIMLTPFEP